MICIQFWHLKRFLVLIYFVLRVLFREHIVKGRDQRLASLLLFRKKNFWRSTIDSVCSDIVFSFALLSRIQLTCPAAWEYIGQIILYQGTESGRRLGETYMVSPLSLAPPPFPPVADSLSQQGLRYLPSRKLGNLESLEPQDKVK